MPSEDYTESPSEVKAEEQQAVVSDEFKARVDELLADASPDEMEYLHSKVMDSMPSTDEPAPEMDMEGMPE